MIQELDDILNNVQSASIIIFGINGAGKSSLMAHLAEQQAFNYNRTRLGNLALKSICHKFNIPPCELNHFVWSGDKMFFTKTGYYTRESHDVDPSKIGIQTEAPDDVECCFLVEYGVYCIDEAQTYYPSRDGGENSGKNYQFSAHEKKRHNNITFLMTTPDGILIDKRIRSNSIGIHIMKRSNVEHKDGRQKIVWHVRYISAGKLNHYLTCSAIEQKNFYKNGTIVCEKNIYNTYDSESSKHLFSDGMTKEQILEAIIDASLG